MQLSIETSSIRVAGDELRSALVNVAELPPMLRASLVRFREAPEDFFVIEQGTAAGTDRVFRIHPSEIFRDLIAALRAVKPKA